MHKPLVYILVLNYNGYQDTIRCIESLEKIDYKNYKILMIDNNSNDDSENILKTKFPKHIFIQTRENIGYAGGNNIGIKFAMRNKADYILILNNDTIVKMDFLTELLKLANPRTVVTPKIYYYKKKNIIWYAGSYVDWKKGVIDTYGHGILDRGQFNKNKYINSIVGCCVLIPKQVFRQVGLLNEKYFLYYEDIDYSEKLQEHNIKMMLCAKSVIWHNENSSTTRSGVLEHYIFRSRFLFFYTFRNKCETKIWLIAFFEYLGQILFNDSILDFIKKKLKI